MDLDSYEVFKMDFRSLISCIECHEDSQNSEIILETLKTIIDICSNENCGKDAFREEGGLDFLLNLISSTSSTFLLEHLLKTLAFVIDENYNSQMHMTKVQVFEVIQVVLKKDSFPVSIYKNALLLLSAILYENSTAQNLISEIGLVQDILYMYECAVPSLLEKNSSASLSLECSSTDIWLSLNSCLCFSVNNPQNEKNQELCSVLFPICLKIMEDSLNNVIMCSVCSFLSLCISSNVKNQDKFAGCDGLLILKRCFQKYFDFLLIDAKECNNIVGKGTLQTLNNIVGIISAVATDHERNAAVLGKLGLLTLMVKLLFVDILDVQLKTRTILSLGHCIYACSSNKSHILETENFDTLLKKSLEEGDDELTSACKYLLQTCLSSGSFDNSTKDELIIPDSIRRDSSISKFEPVNESCRIDMKDLENNSKTRNSGKRTSDCLTNGKLNEKFATSSHVDHPSSYKEMRDENHLNTKRSHDAFSKAFLKNSSNLCRMRSSNKSNYLSPPLQKSKSFPSETLTRSQYSKEIPILPNVYDLLKKSLNKESDMSHKISATENMKSDCNREFLHAVQSPSLSLTDSSPSKSSVSQDAHEHSAEFYNGHTKENKLLKCTLDRILNAEKATLEKMQALNKDFYKDKLRDIMYTSDDSIINSFKFKDKPVFSDKKKLGASYNNFLKNDIKENLRTSESKKSYSHPSTSKTNEDESNFILKLHNPKMENSMSQNDDFKLFSFDSECLKKTDSPSKVTSYCAQDSELLTSHDYKLKSPNIAESCKSLNTHQSFSKRRIKGKQSIIGSTSQKRSRKFEQYTDSSSYMKVAVLLGETCEEHGLIASFDMLKVISIDDA